MYNVKIIEYPYSAQIRIYSELQNAHDNPPPKYTTEPFENTKVRDYGVGTFNSNNELSIKNSIARTQRKIHDYARSFSPSWFITLTYSPKAVVSRIDYNDCIRKFLNWISNQRKRFAKDLIYLAVYEECSNKQGIHFHMLADQTDNIPFVFSGKYNKRGQKIYSVKNWHFGFSTALKIQTNEIDHTVAYLTKYLVKNYYSTNFPKGSHKYFASRNIPRPVETKLIIPPSELDDTLTQIIDSLGKDVVYISEHQGYYVDVKYIELK